MKRNIFISGIITLALFATSCSEDKFVAGQEEGRLIIKTSLSSAGSELIARNISDDDKIEGLLSKLHVVISKSNGDAIRFWHNYQEMIEGGVAQEDGSEISLNLNTGSYKIEGWTGDSVPASFDHQFYKGETSVTLQPYTNTSAELVCKISNVVAKVNYDEIIDHYLSDYTFVLGHSEGTLNFVGRDTRRGYFMMPYRENYLDWELKGTLRNGDNFSLTGSTRVNKATLYTYNFKFDPDVEESGALNLKVSIDETPLETINEPSVIFRTNPKIYRVEGKDEEQEAYQPIGSDNILAVATGYVGNLDFLVRSSGLIKSVRLSTDDNLGANIDGNIQDLLTNGLELLEITDEEYESMSDWLTHEGLQEDAMLGISFMSFGLKSDFTAKIPEGEYVFTVDVIDYDYPGEDGDRENLTGEHKSTGQLFVSVSDDGSIAVNMTASDRAALTPNSAVVRGRIMGDNILEAGFKYRVAGSGEPWENLEVVPADNVASRSIENGSYITATLTGLHEGWSYEYITVFKTEDMEDFRDGAVVRTLTTVAPQLPNSSFEAWSGSSPLLIFDPKQTTVFYPGAETIGSNGEIFWDSGNEGSSTLNKNVTTNSTEYKHDGIYSAKLTSQFVGLGSIGKFAAGNMFIGKYLKTNGMTGGVLGWGRPFTYRPKALKVWVKYNRGTVDRWQTNPYVTNGGPDQGIIYLALMTDDVTTHGDGTYPIELDTRYTSTFFNKDWDNVIASGEHIFYESTEGDDMIEITIPLDYKEGREDEIPAYIMMTCSASRAGDYFCGSTKSVMWIDDMKLIY